MRESVDFPVTEVNAVNITIQYAFERDLITKVLGVTTLRDAEVTWFDTPKEDLWICSDGSIEPIAENYKKNDFKIHIESPNGTVTITLPEDGSGLYEITVHEFETNITEHVRTEGVPVFYKNTWNNESLPYPDAYRFRIYGYTLQIGSGRF